MSIVIKAPSGGGSISLDTQQSVTGDHTLQLPTGVGTAGQVLKNGSTAGTLEFANGGKLVQFKSAEYTTRTSVTTVIPFDDTVPQNDEGTEILTLAITPKSTSNKLIIECLLPMYDIGQASVAACALFQDSTADALAVAANVNYAANYFQQLSLVHIMDAGTTGSTTFKIRVGPDGNTMYLNRRTGDTYYGSTTLHATLQITEVEV